LVSREWTFVLANSFRGPLKKCPNRRPFKSANVKTFSNFHIVRSRSEAQRLSGCAFQDRCLTIAVMKAARPADTEYRRPPNPQQNMIRSRNPQSQHRGAWSAQAILKIRPRNLPSKYNVRIAKLFVFDCSSFGPAAGFSASPNWTIELCCPH